MYKNGDGTRSMAFVTLCDIDQVGIKSLILCDIIFEQLISIYKIHPKSNYMLNCIAYNTKSASSSFCSQSCQKHKRNLCQVLQIVLFAL